MVTIDERKKYWLWYLILIPCVFFGFYFAIGVYPLFDNNDGLYAGIAKQMLLHKDFVIPHLNEVPYIEKPPLLYWLLSLSFSLFGFTAFAARFVTATSAALICVVMVYFTRKTKQPQIGIISSIIFASSIGVSIIARMVYFDMLFTLFASSALFCLFYWYDSQKISILRIGYLFLGLAILAKGLIALVLICGSFGMFLLLQREFRCLYKVLDPIGIILFLAVVLPWHIAAVIQHKGFAWQYFVEEHVMRFLNQREPHDYYHGPIHYYLPRIMVYLFPWSLFMPLIFWQNKNADREEKKILKFCWCCLLIPLLFFSVSSAKANYYMIISMPALAMILGIKIKNLSPKIFNIWSLVILLMVAVAASIGFFICRHMPQIVNCRLSIISIIIYAAVAGMVVLFFVRSSQITIIAIASLIIPVVITMITYLKENQADFSAAAVGVYLNEHAKNDELYIYQDFENFSALAFYAPKSFKIIDSKSSDLYYGYHLPNFKRWFVDKDEFSGEKGCVTKQAYVVVPTKKLPEFYRYMTGSEFVLIKEFGKLVVLKLRF